MKTQKNAVLNYAVGVDYAKDKNIYVEETK